MKKIIILILITIQVFAISFERGVIYSKEVTKETNFTWIDDTDKGLSSQYLKYSGKHLSISKDNKIEVTAQTCDNNSYGYIIKTYDTSGITDKYIEFDSCLHGKIQLKTP